nr:hypothetical protein [Tanacetum cinerariifolium]
SFNIYLVLLIHEVARPEPNIPLQANLGVLHTRSVFGVKGVDLGEKEAPYWTTLRKRESYKPRLRSDGVGAQTPYYARKDFLDYHLLGEWEIARDAELNPFNDVLVFRRMVEFLGAIPINLTSRKAHLLEDKQIPGVGVFDEGVVKLLIEVPYDNLISLLPCGGGTLGEGEIVEVEEVPLVDGVFEGAFSALGDESWYLADGVSYYLELGQ